MKTERVLHKFFPQSGGDYSPTGSRVIRFDISSPQFLDLSQARFACTFTAGAAVGQAVLDGGLGGTIQRISIMNSAGQLLERLDEYALTQTILNQCGDRARLAEDELWMEENFLGNIAQDLPLPAVASTFSLGNGVIRDLSHKLHGAWFQTTKKKLLPPGIGFRLEIELVPNASDAMCNINAVGAANTNAFSLSNVSINIPQVQIMNQSFENQTARMLARGYRWTGSTYRSYTFSANAGAGQKITIPDKSLALTGIIGIARLAADIGAQQSMQNYLRGGNLFGADNGTTQPYNLSIGSQQYPPVQIDYATPNAAAAAAAGSELSARGTSYKIDSAVAQCAAVLGHAPLGSFAKFTAPAMDPVGANAGQYKYGLGMACVQVGYGQGVGIDTQTASLPVTFNVGLSAACTLNVYAQATVTFSMQPNQGMMSVRSFL
jgi:hypothetical protein